MKYEVKFMDLAYSDFAVISDYMAQFYPGTAERFLTELEKFSTVLAENPYAFPIYEPRPQYRKMVIMNYLIFYKVFDESYIVEIHRMLHGARNIKGFLK